MKTLVKKIKPIAIGLVMAVFAVGFSAYINAENEDFLWYELDELGNLLNPDHGTSAPEDDCEALATIYCAVAFEEQAVIDNAGVAPISNVESDPDEMIQRITFRSGK